MWANGHIMPGTRTPVLPPPPSAAQVFPARMWLWWALVQSSAELPHSHPPSHTTQVGIYSPSSTTQESPTHHPILVLWCTAGHLTQRTGFGLALSFFVYVLHVYLCPAGGRGLLREVWIGGNVWLIDEYLNEPRSENSAPQERAYRDNTDPREFNELYNFNQRWSGFFVPPVTSLYTFSVLSDDLSRLYVSPSMDREAMQLLAYSNSHTLGRWDLFETQTSAPVMMEQGQYYYMEAYSNQGGGEDWRSGSGRGMHVTAG